MRVIATLLTSLLLLLTVTPSSMAHHDVNHTSQTCPDGTGGWTKVDSSSGSASGTWGGITWSGTTLTPSIAAGYSVEVCIKSGSQAFAGGLFTNNWTLTSSSGAITIGQGISHVSHRVLTTPPAAADLTVSKTVTGAGAPSTSPAFAFTVTCGTDSESFTLTHGASWSWNNTGGDPDLTAGTSCTVTETDAKGATTTTATYEGGSYTPGAAQVLAAGTTSNDFVFTNDYPASGPPAADLTVSKTVTGAGAPTVSPAFAFTVTCGTDSESFTLAHGASWSWNTDGGDPDLTAGTSCTVTETDAKGASSTTATYEGGSYAPGAAQVLAAGTTTNDFVFTNDYPATTTVVTAAASEPCVVDGIRVTLDNTGSNVPITFTATDSLNAGAQLFSVSVPQATTQNQTVAVAEDAAYDIAVTATNGQTTVNTWRFNGTRDCVRNTVIITDPDPDPTPTPTPTPGPRIELRKSADAAEYNVGDTITYTYVIRNRGDVTLTDLTLVDDVLGDLSDDIADDELAPEESTTVTTTQIALAEHIPGLTNVAVTTGTAPDGRVVTDTDEVTVEVTEVLGVVIDNPDPVVPAPAPNPRPQAPAPAPAPAPVPAPDPVLAKELPRTGSPSGMLAAMALAMVALGGAMLRRRQPE